MNKIKIIICPKCNVEVTKEYDGQEPKHDCKKEDDQLKLFNKKT